MDPSTSDAQNSKTTVSSITRKTRSKKKRSRKSDDEKNTKPKKPCNKEVKDKKPKNSSATSSSAKTAENINHKSLENKNKNMAGSTEPPKKILKEINCSNEVHELVLQKNHQDNISSKVTVSSAGENSKENFKPPQLPEQTKQSCIKVVATMEANGTQNVDDDYLNSFEFEEGLNKHLFESTNVDDLLSEIIDTNNMLVHDTTSANIQTNQVNSTISKKQLDKNNKRTDNSNNMERENKELKSSLAEKEADYQAVLKRNMRLQDEILMRMQEYAARQINPYSCRIRGDHPVGYPIGENKMYCGNNVVIDETTYYEAKNNAAAGKAATEYDRFVKTIAHFIFGDEELKISIVKGRKCNAKKNSVVKPALDPIKLSAVHDIFAFYLENEKKKNTVEIFFELAHVGSYVGAKIQELCRPPRKARAKKGKTKKSKNGQKKESDDESSSTLGAENQHKKDDEDNKSQCSKESNESDDSNESSEDSNTKENDESDGSDEGNESNENSLRNDSDESENEEKL
ncbi:hypothetical protein TKK_0013651 [Trichogramma kaykai]